MAEHFHLLITEAEVGDPPVVMKVSKERFSKQVHALEKNARKGQSCAQNENGWGSRGDAKRSGGRGERLAAARRMLRE